MISGIADFSSLTSFLAGTTILSAGLALHFMRKSGKLAHEVETTNETLNSLGEGFYRSTLDGKQITANPALAHLNGYETEEEQLRAVNDIAMEWYVEPERRETFKRQLFERGSITNFVSEVHRHKTRERIWVSENARLVSDPETGEPRYYEGTVREVTDQFTNAELRNRLSKLAENLPGGLFQLMRNKDGKFSAPYLSKSFFKLLGLPQAYKTKSPNSFLKFIDPEDLEAYLEEFRKSEQDLKTINHQFRFKRPDGKHVWLHLTATPERLACGDMIWHGHINDITRAKLREIDRSRSALEDPLTGLPTRKLFNERLQAIIKACDRRNEHAALYFLDLDNFKELNDTLGHESGDEVLRQVARRLRKQVRASDVVARLAGDEFVLIIDNLGNDANEASTRAGTFASKVLGLFQDGFLLGEQEYFTSPSIGVAMISPGLPEADEILNSADMAMYKAKKHGRNRYFINTENTVEGKALVADVERDLPQAIEQNQLELLLQAQADETGRTTGAEAFLRWNHPEHGVILPADFIPTALRLGLTGAINQWVMGNAICILSEWHEQPAFAHLALSVNISAEQLGARDFRELIERGLSKARIERSKLTLELAEHMLQRSPEKLGQQMEAIKRSGVRFSLDDFGTGSSSLSHLNMLPFDEIKIDGNFISGIESKARSRSLIEGILGLARALELDTVAEQVISPYQFDYLKNRGCRYFQGYLFSPPISRPAFEEKVRREQDGGRLSALA